MKYQVIVTSEKHTGEVVFDIDTMYFYVSIEKVKELIVKGKTIISREIKIADLHFVARRA